jgi:5-methylcytosine-specific restriction protein A
VPYRLATPCRFTGCPKLSQERYCVEHKRVTQRAQDAKRPFRLYGDPAWRALRARVLTEHQVCRCGQRTTVVNHIVAVAAGGGYLDPTNLEALCRSCHNSHTATNDMGRDANGRWTGPRGAA